MRVLTRRLDPIEGLDAFEAAVRADEAEVARTGYEIREAQIEALRDEAAGLVDILARALEAIALCCDGGLNDWWEPDPYWDHTPDCPWVEGMNAVAERKGS